MQYIKFPPAVSGELGLTIEIKDREIIFSLNLEKERNAEGRQLQVAFPAFRRHLSEFAAAFDTLASIHKKRKRGDVDQLRNKFWVEAEEFENRTSYPFRATCVEHDNKRMYITASFVKDPDPEKDAYERIEFPLDIQASRDIALAIRRLAQTSPR